MIKKAGLFAVIVFLMPIIGCSRQFTRKEVAEDIQFAVKKLNELHPNPFFRTPEEDFNHAVNEILNNLPDKIDSRYMQAETTRLLALVHDTHTRCRDQSDFFKNHWQAGGKIFPVYFHSRNGDAYVCGFFGSDADTLGRIKKGHRLTAIDSVPIDLVIKHCMRYISGDSDYEKYPLLEWNFYYYLWLMEGSRDRYALDLIDTDGNPYTETVDAASKNTVSKKNAGNGKTSFNPFAFTFYKNKTVCLFNAPSFGGNLWSTYRRTLDRCLSEMRQSQTELFVVDLRKNGGGHGGLGQELLQKTTRQAMKSPSKYDKSTYSPALAAQKQKEDKPLSGGSIAPIDSPWKGQVVLLCGPDTGSAAVWTAALAKDNHVALIAGQETGGRPSAFMEIVTITLPHSKLKCDISMCYFLRPGGYDDGRGVLPDLPLDITLNNEAIIEKIQTYLKAHPVNRESKL